MKIIIQGDPIAKARHVKTKKGFAYDPQWELKKRVSRFLELEIKEYFDKSENRIEGFHLSNGIAFEVDWYFYMPIPKSFSQSKRNACRWGLIEHTIKPDRSNMEKFYEDCANGVLWYDDSQITCGKVVKRYCENDNPRTEIHVKVVKQPPNEMCEIVSLFTPQEVSDIVEDATKLLHVQTSDLPKVACFLSKIADLHAPKLSKINKKYPKHWKKFECNSPFLQY